MTSPERSRKIAGQVRRGLGRGARQVTDAPTVYACVRRDYRWWWSIDDRAVYLARLIRDLGLSVAPLIARLYAPDVDDENNEFTNTLDVLEVLGRAGAEDVVDELRRYVREGPRRQEVLETIARNWPVEYWDDLLPAVRGKIEGPFIGKPWDRWAEREPAIHVTVRKPRPPDPWAGLSDDELLGVLRDPGRSAEHRAVLRQFGRRPPVPALLEVVEGLTAGHLQDALAPLGAAVLPAARRWARARGRWCWDGWQFLAAHGDESDVPLLLDGIAWLDDRADDLCGYDVLVTGLARIGGPGTADVPTLIRRLWFTPHSYERASYLRAYLALRPEDAEPLLQEGLWDCEQDVRRLAAERVPLSAEVRERLSYLRDDPMEDAAVRGVAAARLEN
jgi:hypothetical protein